MKKNAKKLSFRQLYSDSLPDYISKEQLLEASRDCLSYQIIETDPEKLLSVLSKLDARVDNETFMEGKSWPELAKHFFGFLIYNQMQSRQTEILLLQNHNVPMGYSYDDDACILCVDERDADDEEGVLGTYGSIISLEPLLILVELGNVWGYMQTKKGIVDVEICSPTEDLYDWKPLDEFTEKPFIRNPEEDKK
jgi:hypothetical protein